MQQWIQTKAQHAVTSMHTDSMYTILFCCLLKINFFSLSSFKVRHTARLSWHILYHLHYINLWGTWRPFKNTRLSLTDLCCCCNCKLFSQQKSLNVICQDKQGSGTTKYNLWNCGNAFWVFSAQVAACHFNQFPESVSFYSVLSVVLFLFDLWHDLSLFLVHPHKCC